MKKTQKEIMKHWIVYYLFNGLHFSSTERFNDPEEAERFIKEHDNSGIHFTYIIKNVATNYNLIYDSEEGFVDFDFP